MNCESARESMILAMYEELPARSAAVLEQHVSACEACFRELESLRTVIESLAAHPPAEPDPNLLAQSRMRLDEALDNLPQGGMLAALRTNASSWMHHLRSAPALATLLLGVGFLSGNFTYRYQVAQAKAAHKDVVTLTNPTGGGVSSISGVTQLPGEMVQVSYNRVVPEMVQGSLDSPQIRQLLMVGTKSAVNNDVRASSVAMLAGECSIGHECQVDALVNSLRMDRNPKLRLKALEGLGRYVSRDLRVRDAIAQAVLTDQSDAIRSKAIAMLEPVQGDTSVRQVLQTVSTRDVNPYIRNVSTRALIGSSSIQ